MQCTQAGVSCGHYYNFINHFSIVLFHFILSVFLGIALFTGIYAQRILICSSNTFYMSSVCVYVTAWGHCLEFLILYAYFKFNNVA